MNWLKFNANLNLNDRLKGKEQKIQINSIKKYLKICTFSYKLNGNRILSFEDIAI